MSATWMHIICWTPSLAITILPLTTSNIPGQDSSMSTEGPCVMTGPNSTGMLWYTVWTLIGIFTLIAAVYYTVITYIFLRNNGFFRVSDGIMTKEHSLFNVTISYPFIFIATHGLVLYTC